MSVRIVVDSACDISMEEAEKLNLIELPLMIRFVDKNGESDGKEYRDGIDLSRNEFYHKLCVEGLTPKTSQVPPYEYEQIFEDAKEKGDEVYCLTISSGVSGTYQSVCLAAQDYKGTVWVTDSRHFCASYRVLAIQAARLRDQGYSAAQLAQQMEKEIEKVRILSVFSTLEYLRRGGRISAAASFVGNMLNIKPVVTISEGVPKVLAKARGYKQGNVQMNKFLLQDDIDYSKPITFGYSGLSDQAVREYIAQYRDLYKTDVDAIPVAHVGATVGAYSGPDAYTVAYFVK